MTPNSTTLLHSRLILSQIPLFLISLTPIARAATVVELQIPPFDGPAAEVVFLNHEAVLAKGTFDAKGWLRQEFNFAPESGPRVIVAEIRRAPHPTDKFYFNIGPGAELGFELDLPTRELTTLRLFDADGKPAAHHNFSIDEWQSPQYADAKGEFRISHGRLEAAPLRVRFLGHTHHVFDGGGVKEIRRPAYSFLPSNSFFNLSASQVGDYTEQPARLRGHLLLNDGQPARGWHIATGTSRGGGWTPIMGIAVPSLTHYDIYYLDLVAVDEDGAFELFPASRDLVVISPDGLRLRYPLNPGAWRGGDIAEKETTITLPPIDHRKIRLRFEREDGEDGEIASGIEIQPGRSGQAWDIWDLSPTRFDHRSWRLYPDRTGPPALASILSLKQSNAKGEVDLPIHPWRPYQSISWSAGDERRGHAQLSDISEPDAVLDLEVWTPDIERKSEARNLRRITYSFRNSHGKMLAPTAVSWTTHLGRGRFLNPQGEARLVLYKSTKEVKFTHTTPAGAIERFTHHLDPDGAMPAMPVEAKFTRAHDREAPVSLQGTVRKHSGQPAPDVRLHLFKETDDINQKFTQLTAVTDEKGHYSFEEAPDDCGFYISAMWEGRVIGVTDIADPPKVTADRRRVDFKLHPAGAVEVKLLDAKHVPVDLLLLPTLKGRNEVYLRASLREPMMFYCPYVRSGEYHLAYRIGKDTHKLKRISVRRDHENRFEIAADKIMGEGIDQAKKAPTRTSVTVMRDGKILPGAMVYVTSTSKPPPGTYTMRGHVLNYVGDTTDNNGRADFTLLPGSYHFAARDGHGNVGWTEVEIGVEPGDARVVLRPLEKTFPKLPVPAEAREAHKVPQGAELASELLGIYQGSRM